MNFDVEKYRIFECITGSNLYGMATPESDTDYRGVCIPPMNVLLNPFENFDQKDAGFQEEDRAIYSLKKFVQICADANPNIIELLFIPEQNVIMTTPLWQKIVDNRHLFVSKKVRYTFSGYAYSQLKLIERHRKWFINPPKQKPHRKDFDLPHEPVISLAWLKTAKDTLSNHIIKDEYLYMMQQERSYIKAKEEWDHYMMWEKNRNPKRKPLEEQWGYDTKHASHLVRLLTECEEILRTGEIQFPLWNAEELLAIKNGKYTYDEIVIMAENFDQKFNQMYEESTLPFGADRKALTQLYMAIIEEAQVYIW
jgi:predicted nucleotidyltransferase